MQVRTPKILRPPVWPLPRSLATTCGISVDVFSSPYLDVSVQAVPHVHLFYSMHVDTVLPYRVSPFGNLRIDAYVPLPEAYRSLSRPSSAPDAKAFPLRSFSLDLFSRIIGLSKTSSQRLSLKSQCPPESSPSFTLPRFCLCFPFLLPCSCFLRLRLFIRFSRYAFSSFRSPCRKISVLNSR